MINFLNEIQIKYKSASFHGWVSLRHQRSKHLNTQRYSEGLQTIDENVLLCYRLRFVITVIKVKR